MDAVVQTAGSRFTAVDVEGCRGMNDPAALASEIGVMINKRDIEMLDLQELKKLSNIFINLEQF
jgi:hypothetical protein